MAVALLPEAIAGWVATEPQEDDRCRDGGPANAAALKEYDFSDGMTADYKRSGETLSLRALRFHDASGAYGAYSFYRQNGWPRESIGSGATSDHNRVLFWHGDVVVDANFSKMGRCRAPRFVNWQAIPSPEGPGRWRRPFWQSAEDSLDGQTTHYAVGPAGYAGSGGVLPAEVVGFDRGAEAVTASYTLRSGQATLTSSTTLRRRWPRAGNQDSRLHQGGEATPACLAKAADGLGPGVAGGAAQRAAGGAGQRGRDSRREPQAAGDGAL